MGRGVPNCRRPRASWDRFRSYIYKRDTRTTDAVGPPSRSVPGKGNALRRRDFGLLFHGRHDIEMRLLLLLLAPVVTVALVLSQTQQRPPPRSPWEAPTAEELLVKTLESKRTQDFVAGAGSTGLVAAFLQWRAQLADERKYGPKDTKKSYRQQQTEMTRAESDELLDIQLFERRLEKMPQYQSEYQECLERDVRNPEDARPKSDPSIAARDCVGLEQKGWCGCVLTWDIDYLLVGPYAGHQHACQISARDLAQMQKVRRGDVQLVQGGLGRGGKEEEDRRGHQSERRRMGSLDGGTSARTRGRRGERGRAPLGRRRPPLHRRTRPLQPGLDHQGQGFAVVAATEGRRSGSQAREDHGALHLARPQGRRNGVGTAEGFGTGGGETGICLSSIERLLSSVPWRSLHFLMSIFQSRSLLWSRSLSVALIRPRRQPTVCMVGVVSGVFLQELFSRQALSTHFRTKRPRAFL